MQRDPYLPYRLMLQLFVRIANDRQIRTIVTMNSFRLNRAFLMHGATQVQKQIDYQGYPLVYMPVIGRFYQLGTSCLSWFCTNSDLLDGSNEFTRNYRCLQFNYCPVKPSYYFHINKSIFSKEVKYIFIAAIFIIGLIFIYTLSLNLFNNSSESAINISAIDRTYVVPNLLVSSPFSPPIFTSISLDYMNNLSGWKIQPREVQTEQSTWLKALTKLLKLIIT